MNRPPIIGLLLVSTLPLYAQAQQPDVAKLKADAQKVVSIIKGDKTKTQAHCAIADLGQQMVKAALEKDEKKADALMQRAVDLEKVLGPEYTAFFDAFSEADPNSKDVQDILSTFAMLEQSCPH
jgi:hypothetical protein